jgi:DNA-directed RNA polymerase subunit RPC12/RpoP
MLYKKPIFYVPFSFLAGPLLARLLNTDNASIVMGPFFLSLIFWVVNRYNQEKEEDGVSPSGKLICLSCQSRFDKPKMRGNDWIEVILYIFLFIIGGVIYSIWRRSGSGECPQCGSRAFRSFTETTVVLSDKRDEVDCPFCAEKILAKATICKHCGKQVRAAAAPL